MFVCVANIIMCVDINCAICIINYIIIYININNLITNDCDNKKVTREPPSNKN